MSRGRAWGVGRQRRSFHGGFHARNDGGLRGGLGGQLRDDSRLDGGIHVGRRAAAGGRDHGDERRDGDDGCSSDVSQRIGECFGAALPAPEWSLFGAFLCECSLDGDVDVAGDGLGDWAAVLGGFRCALEALRGRAWHVAGDGQGAAVDLPSDFLLRERNGCADFESGWGRARLRESVRQRHAVAGRMGRSEQLLGAGRRFFAVRSRSP